MVFWFLRRHQESRSHYPLKHGRGQVPCGHENHCQDAQCERRHLAAFPSPKIISHALSTRILRTAPQLFIGTRQIVALAESPTRAVGCAHAVSEDRSRRLRGY